MKKLFLASLAAAVAAGAYTPASAQSSVAYSNNPVKLVSYSVEPAYTAPVPAWGGTLLGIESAGNVTVSFVNSANAPATSVEFAVREGKRMETIVDKGTFSPGASITHEFALNPEFGSTSDVEIEQVTFADGTSWQHA
jgi:ABC-type oligopeptide transport system substrate-binding subunit